MTFNRGSRISVFSTLFHYERESIYEQDLLMGSNCTCLSGSQCNLQMAKYWNKEVQLSRMKYLYMYNIYQGGNIQSDVWEAKRHMWLSKPSKCHQSDPLFWASRCLSFLYANEIWLIQFRRGPMPSLWQRPGAALIVPDREIKDQDGVLY